MITDCFAAGSLHNPTIIKKVIIKNEKNLEKSLTNITWNAIIIKSHADMAELADAHDSGSCEQYAHASSSLVIRIRFHIGFTEISVKPI